MAAEMLSDEQISDFKDAFTHFDLGKLIFLCYWEKSYKTFIIKFKL